MKIKRRMTRRQMLGTIGATGAALGFPAIVPSSVFGANAPSNRITVGMIGVGRQGLKINLKTMVHMPDVQLVAVSDVDKWRMNNAKKKIDETYGNNDCKEYGDWREVIARDDIDAIMNSTSGTRLRHVDGTHCEKTLHGRCSAPSEVV